MSSEFKQIFSLTTKAKNIFQEKIDKEHSEFMDEFIAVARDPNKDPNTVPKPFQNKLSSFSDQRDAFSHMISILEVKIMLADSTKDSVETQINDLHRVMSNKTSLTGNFPTLSRTNHLLKELNELLSQSNTLNDKEKIIAERMQIACSDLITTVTEIQSSCNKLHNSKKMGI